MKRSALLIMAAGLGSRYGGNKQVDRIGPDGEILMQYSVYDAIRAGFDKIVFIIKPQHRELLEEVCKNFRDKGVEICFAYQDFSSIPESYKIPEDRIKPFGTVHAVLCAKDVISEPFAIINADDFYGADSFKTMHSSLTSLSYPEGLMVAYDLDKTVSPNGTVTRGICEEKNGYLDRIAEVYDIGIEPDGSISDKTVGALDPKSPVSMNMWGFAPEIFELMQSSFEEFLANIKEGDIKAEYVLPNFVGKAIANGDIKIKVLRTDSEWFGVTYQEDRPAVVERLLKMKQNGTYPAGLK